MNKVALKKELHRSIDEINDTATLEAVYTLLNKTREPNYTLTPEQFEELDKRLLLHDSGKNVYHSLREIKKSLKNSKRKYYIKSLSQNPAESNNANR